MNTKKQIPNVKLQKTSVIFMQLGLILAMFIVYIILEQETYYNPIKTAYYGDVGNITDTEEIVKTFKIEKKLVTKKTKNLKIKKVKPVIQKPKATNKFKTIKDESKKEETAVLTSTEGDDKPTKITIDDITEVVDKEIIDEEIPFSVVEFAPEYPGCKGSIAQKKLCFNKKIKKLIQRKFNTDVAQDIGLESGKRRMNVEFIINKNGNITNIKVNAPHKRLEKEVNRVIKLLPKMKPAIQGKKTASVRFNLPITFIVE